jgi:hypothetical protein
MESAHRTSLAKGEVGIRERNIIPTLTEFCTSRIEPWAKATFEKSCPKNWLWYRTGIRALTTCKPLAGALLDKITGELACEFAAQRLREGMKVSTANNSLRVLRRILNLAVEWGVLDGTPKIKILSGESRRERVITRMKRHAISQQPPNHLPRLLLYWPTQGCVLKNASGFAGMI